MKTAILQVADTGPLESLVVMLRCAGYACAVPSQKLMGELRHVGCDTVLDWRDLVKDWGYPVPMPLPEAGEADMRRSDVLYVDVKGHRNSEKVLRKWPSLAGKVLWYRINGGCPEIVPGCGDEVDPPCPVVTPNQWYGLSKVTNHKGEEYSLSCVTQERAYVCWPPFHRWIDYQRERVNGFGRSQSYGSPLCLIHNLQGWGYGALVPEMQKLGVKCHGLRSPDGLLRNDEAKVRLTKAVAMVHLKSNDAPGYALYESMASGCPVICSRRLIWRCRMQHLLVPGETCLVFDRETHDALTTDDVDSCRDEIQRHLMNLSDPTFNKSIGEAGRERLRKTMWNESNNGPDFSAFMKRCFPL